MNILVSLFTTSATYLTANYFFSLFSQKKNVGILLKLLYFASFAVFFITITVLPKPPLKFPILLICTWMISTRFSLKLHNSVLLTIIFIAFNTVFELIITVLFSILFKTDTNSTMEGILFTFGSIVTKLIISVFLFVISSLKKEMFLGKFKPLWISIYIMPVATIWVVTLLYYAVRLDENNTFLKNMFLAGSMLLILCNILIFKIINDINKTVVKEKELNLAHEIIENQRKQYNLLFEKNEKIANLRHNYKNFLIGVLAMLEVNKTDEIKDRLNDELNEVSHSSLQLCGDSVIDSLIEYKKAKAHEKGIDIKLETRNINNINVSGIDFSVLLGNAIDNAIEALEKTDIKEKNIDIRIFVTNEQMMLSVANMVEENVEINALRSTKEGMHGYGILSMKAIAEKYNGSITFSCENKLFKVIMLLSNI